MNNQKVRVKEISSHFKMSEVLIRKDLKLLEEIRKAGENSYGSHLKKEIPGEMSLKKIKAPNIDGKNKIVDKL